MKKILELRDVSFTYKQRTVPSVSHVDLTIAQGDFILLTGVTGCGKSTLLKTLNGLIPHESGGNLTGQIIVDGQDTRDHSIAELSQRVGMVFQSPDDQLFSTTVSDETAFILENIGMPPEKITPRVHETLLLVGLLDKKDASIHALSGGQKQRLALASVLAAQPQVLALDEPISQLDPQGASELLGVLQELNQRLGLTIIIVEHRLHEVMPLCHRVLLMHEGQMVWQGTREEAYDQAELFNTYGLRMPQTIDICRRLGVTAASAQVDDAVSALAKAYQVPLQADRTGSPFPLRKAQAAMPAIEIENLSFQYEPNGPMIVTDINISIPQGQFVALMGNNGAGKSTLLHQIGGLLQPKKGMVKVLGKPMKDVCPVVGMVLQNPDFMLFNNTVADEILFALRQQAAGFTWSQHCQQLIENLGLLGMTQEFPLALSRGQRLRVAMAAVLASRPSVLLLDEPTTGQDIGNIKDIVKLLKKYTNQGGTVIFCTHDSEVAARYAERIVVMCQGRIVADGRPKSVFTHGSILQSAGLRAPTALAVAQQLYGGTELTVEEVVNYVQQECMGSSAG